ncbi:acetolactate synthase-1/2/3 large subunit [Methylovorus glucosotrophus]|uniref:thiamine pyrophosphate-binding protein n=1 Tax=Methylovorus glucosotrophus TaxID=266009 RepID=UPI00133196D7|nr:thiamine pyrophosphate-binding protein [Methylovorus glucosotrophus]KAF0835967.1 acetolactate synthase-1/2/3 large subunit [Methylovorus glucosotrophus]
MKYSDLISLALKEEGYTHCFFVAGGNIMHLLESLSHQLTCIPVAHEVAASIAAEYYNQTAPDGSKALALVTAGPGLTNILTGMAGAFLESRELLVLGGQVKTADLSRGRLRQRGIQEIDGVSLAKPVSVRSHLLDNVVPQNEFVKLISYQSAGPRPGPVFIEIPLDVQARDVNFGEDAFLSRHNASFDTHKTEKVDWESLLSSASRPAILLGGGVSREAAKSFGESAAQAHLPIFTTWNGADRIAASHPCYFGRPNTWGQRYSNILLQQADLILAFGTRLGLQQTGFNWQAFGPHAKIVQIDCDQAELDKGHPHLHLGICADANVMLDDLSQALHSDWSPWHAYCQSVKQRLPLIEENVTGPEYISPHRFVEHLSKISGDDDVIIPCSSGSAFTVMMMVFSQKSGQRMVTNKGLASMGYGLSGAIGAAIANPDKRTILVEGDGGFSQNIQEIGTAAINQLNLKMFIFDDSGYASIRMTQRSYFGGRYVGCDRNTLLGLPNWEKLFAAFEVPSLRLRPGYEADADFQRLFAEPGPAAFIVTIDPEQTYFPKITSRVTPTGMESNPIHLMTPDLPDELMAEVGRYL